MTLIGDELAAGILERALRHGGDWGEVYAEDRYGFAVGIDDSKIERPQTGSERGASVRVVQGDATYFGHVDGLAEDDLMRVAESVSQAVRAGDAAEVAALTAATAETVHPVRERPEGVDAARKAEILRECDERARSSSGDVVQVTSSYAENRRIVEIFNSDGLAAADDRTRVRLGAQVIARRNGRVETGHDTVGGHVGFEILGQDPAAVAERAARKAVIALDAVDAPSGKMPIVVGNAFGGVLLHEAVGHGLEADHIQKRSSVWAGKLGQMVAESFVTAYDDGRMTNEWGSDGIDDEGTPTQRTTIVEDGKLVSYLYDLLRARKDGVTSTGNGRRESFRHLPIPRMTNTYFAPGTETKDELIAGVERGLYAVSFGGGQVEPATGDFVFGVSEAYLIENGEITSPVRGATLIGNGIEALAAVDGIADDLDIATGFCGKAGQRVPAGVGQPHVRIRALTVGGTAA